MLRERLQVSGVPSEPVQGSRKELVVVYLIQQMVRPHPLTPPPPHSPDPLTRVCLHFLSSLSPLRSALSRLKRS